MDTPLYFGHRARLKEKLLKNGVDSLADYEVLELLLMQTIFRKDVKPLAKELLKKFGSFAGVLNASVEELCSVPGVSRNVATHFKITLAACTHLRKIQIQTQPIFKNWDVLKDYCLMKIAYESIECMHILYLNIKCQLIKDEEHQRGTFSYTSMYPREILKQALNLGAVSVILVHNHPSGDPTPSQADIRNTKALQEILEKVDISIFDHLIIGKGNICSFRELGLL